jgi:hypothetical protein
MLQEKPSALKSKREHPTFQNMKFLNFFPIYVGHFFPPLALLDPDSESGYGSTDLIQSESNPDPDPKH